MYREDREYGLGLINSYLPTARAMRYLNWFRSAGWHKCNAGYHLQYPEGDDGVLALFTVSGEGRLRLGETDHCLGAGTAAVIAPFTPMEYHTGRAGDWEFYWINMLGPAVNPIAMKMAEDGASVFRPASAASCVKTVRELIALEDSHKFRFEMEVSRRIARLFEELLADRFFPCGGRTAEEPLSARVAAYLEEHCGETVSMEALSRRFYLSENQLIRLFHKEIGYTPYEYLKRYRLLRACELLQITALPVEEIGRRTGFHDSSNFIYQFRSLYGLTPRTYRRLYGPAKQP